MRRPVRPRFCIHRCNPLRIFGETTQPALWPQLSLTPIFSRRATNASRLRPRRPALPDASPEERLRVALVRRIADGDANALKSLYHTDSPRLFGLATHILGHNAEAEDAVQDAFLRVWKTAERYDPTRASVDTWLLLIVRSQCLDRLRARRRQQSKAEALAEDPTYESVVPFEAPDWGSENAAAESPAHRALRGLPEHQREPLELAFFEGYTHQEIARILDRPLGSIKSDIRRALARIRKGGLPHA